MILDSTSTMILMGAMAIAIMKFRLYNINIGSSLRSVTFGALAMFIAGVYVAIVVGVGGYSGGGAPFGLQVVASVLIGPWHSSLCGVGFNGGPIGSCTGSGQPPMTCWCGSLDGRPSRRMRSFCSRIPRLIVDGTGASTAASWVRSDAGFRTAASWPNRSRPGISMTPRSIRDRRPDHSFRCLHDGELLGGLSLVKREVNGAQRPRKRCSPILLGDGPGVA